MVSQPCSRTLPTGTYPNPHQFHVYIPKTRNEQIVDTLDFFPHNYNMPTISTSQALPHATHTLTKLLQQKPTPLCLQVLTPTHTNSLQHLADIFTYAALRVVEGSNNQPTNQSTKPLSLNVTPHQP